MDRLRTLRSLTAMLAASVTLAACGGSHSTALPALSDQSGGKSVASENATFQFTVPKTTTSAVRVAGRAPRYVSSATKSIQLALTSAALGLPTPNNPQILNVPNGTGSAPGAPCTASGANYICTLTVKLPIGSDGLTFTTYDANNATGNVLSQQKSTVTIVQGVANGPGGAFTIVLDANASTMTVSGTAPCTSGGSIGSTYGSVGTTPATFTVAYTDPASKTIVSPGQPALAVTATGVTGGTLSVSVNQAAQTFTVTPSATGVSGTINVAATPASAGDGLSFNRTKSFTFQTGAAPGPNFLAVAEQITPSSGQIALYYVTLGGSGGADSFAAASPATLPVTNSINEGKPDVDTPQGLQFDVNGNLLVANAGNGTAGDRGDLACIPAGAIVTGATTSTTTSTNASIPEGIAYDSRDGSVALSDTFGSAPDFMSEYVLTGNYTAAPSARNIVRAGPYTGDTAVVNIPALAAGTFATAITTGTNNFNGGSSKIAILSPTGTETDITSTTDSTIDDPVGLAWDAANSQLAIVNNSYHPAGTGGALDLYSVSGTPSKVKTITSPPGAACACAWFNVAASPDGHIAASYNDLSADFRIQVYDNTAARNPVGGPIPFNGTTSSNGGNYIFDTGTYSGGANGSEKIDQMIWLSNTKLLVAFTTQATGKQGLYIFDISSIVTQASFGFSDVTGNAFPAFPKQTGFQSTSLTPFAVAYKP